MNCLGKPRHALVACLEYVPCSLPGTYACLECVPVWDVCLSGMCACLEGRGWLLVDKTKIEPLSGTGGGELVRQAASTISHCLVPGLGMFCLPENELDLRYSIHDMLVHK